MSKITNGTELARQSWDALKQNRQLLAFPLISGIVMIFISIFFAIGIVGTGIIAGIAQDGSELSTSEGVIGAVIAFIYYFISYTIIIFSNVALVGAVMKIINGEEATVSDGISIAMSRLGKIIIYALISATIGLLARTIARSGRNSDNGIIKIVAIIVGSLIQGAWDLIVFFAIPVLVAENRGVVDSMKHGFEIFKQTWGEGFVGRTTISVVSCLVTLAILLVGGGLLFFAISSGSVALTIAVIVLLVLVFVGIGLINGAVNGVFQASLYHYATTGEAGPFISNQFAEQAFKET